MISFKGGENKDKMRVVKSHTKYLMDGNKKQMLMTANLAQLFLWSVLKC